MRPMTRHSCGILCLLVFFICVSHWFTQNQNISVFTSIDQKVEHLHINYFVYVLKEHTPLKNVRVFCLSLNSYWSCMLFEWNYNIICHKIGLVALWACPTKTVIIKNKRFASTVLLYINCHGYSFFIWNLVSLC